MPLASETQGKSATAACGASPEPTSRPQATDVAVPTSGPLGSEGAVDDGLLPGHETWSLIVSFAASLREDLDRRELSITAASLEGSTLSVELRDAPIVGWSGLRRREVGRVADRTRRRYGEDLRALWREISGDPEAVLDLGGGTER